MDNKRFHYPNRYSILQFLTARHLETRTYRLSNLQSLYDMLNILWYLDAQTTCNSGCSKRQPKADQKSVRTDPLVVSPILVRNPIYSVMGCSMMDTVLGPPLSLIFVPAYSGIVPSVPQTHRINQNRGCSGK